MSEGRQLAPIGILTADEEFALSLVREALAHENAQSSSDKMKVIEQAIYKANGQIERGPDVLERQFRIGSAFFSIQASADGEGIVLITFIED